VLGIGLSRGGWQEVDWGGGMVDRCRSEDNNVWSQLECGLASPGVLSNWLSSWYAGYGYPYSEPSWREDQMKFLDADIAKILPTLSVYGSWSYRGECWKKQKLN
jgi:hypothetical protein